MKLLLHIVLIVGVAIRIYSCNIFLIKDYLKTNYLTTMLLVTCEKNYEVNTIETIDLQHIGIWSNVLDISNESVLSNSDYNTFFGRVSHPHCVVLNLECNYSNVFLAQISKRTLFHNERNWLIFSSSFRKGLSTLSPQNINFDAEIALAVPVKRNYDEEVNKYNIYEVFNPSSRHGGRLNISRLGYWNKGFGFDIPSKQTKIERRRNLHGITLSSVISLTNIPTHTTFLEHLNSNNFPHLDSMSRLSYRLFVLMMEMYNFKMNIKLSEIWGSLDSKGKWHGAIGSLNRTEVDLCVTALRWDNKRYGAFEHTTHCYHVQVQFIFLHPKSIKVANVYLAPFEVMVWCAIIGLAMLSVYVVRITYLFENKRIKDFINQKEFNEGSFSNSMLMVFGFIFQQSYSGNPLLISSRILTISVLILSVVVFQFYSSFIVGSLLTESPKNIKTVKQLLNSPFEFGIDVVPYVIDNFHVAKEAHTVQLYNKIMKNPEKALMPLETGLHLMKEGGFVFNTDGSYAYILLRNILTDSEKCDLQRVDYVPKIPTAPAVPNKSPFKELIKISIRKLTETGILSYYNKVWLGRNPKPKCEISKLFVAPIDFIHFSSALYILVIGILCSITIMIFEIVIHRFSKRS